MKLKMVTRCGRSRSRLLAISVVFLALGCSSKGTVRGKVTLGGTKPVTSGVVILTGANDARYSGLVSKAGEYEITNVTPGDMKVSLVNSMGGYGSGPVKDPAVRPVVPKKLPIPGKYQSPENGLKVTVKPGPQTFNIDLTP